MLRNLDEMSPLPVPPVPVPGCTECTRLAKQRRYAQAQFDRSGETDLNVLLRKHQRQEHHA